MKWNDPTLRGRGRPSYALVRRHVQLNPPLLLLSRTGLRRMSWSFGCLPANGIFETDNDPDFQGCRRPPCALAERHVQPNLPLLRPTRTDFRRMP